MSQFASTITYFPSEGKSHLHDCLRLAFDSAKRHDLRRLIIFTALGEGIKLALEMKANDPSLNEISIVGVTFPCGKAFTDPARKPMVVQIDPQDRRRFKDSKVPIVTSNMPLDPIQAKFRDHGILGQDSGLIANALSIFGGGMALCVQAVLMACDAGEIEIGEHVVAMSADTAIIARATPTAQLLTEFIVREIICKPVFLTIVKNEKVTEESRMEQPALPMTIDASVNESPAKS